MLYDWASALCSYFMLVDCVIMAEQILLVFGMEATLPRPILCFVYTVQVSGKSRIPLKTYLILWT